MLSFLRGRAAGGNGDVIVDDSLGELEEVNEAEIPAISWF